MAAPIISIIKKSETTDTDSGYRIIPLGAESENIFISTDIYDLDNQDSESESGYHVVVESGVNLNEALIQILQYLDNEIVEKWIHTYTTIGEDDKQSKVTYISHFNNEAIPSGGIVPDLIALYNTSGGATFGTSSREGFKIENDRGTDKGINSVEIGSDNNASSSNSLVVGDTVTSQHKNSLTAGLELLSVHENGTVLGQYNALPNENDYTYPIKDGLTYNHNNSIFTIGVGSSNTTRSNAIEVLTPNPDGSNSETYPASLVRICNDFVVDGQAVNTNLNVTKDLVVNNLTVTGTTKMQGWVGDNSSSTPVLKEHTHNIPFTVKNNNSFRISKTFANKKYWAESKGNNKYERHVGFHLSEDLPTFGSNNTDQLIIRANGSDSKSSYAYLDAKAVSHYKANNPTEITLKNGKKIKSYTIGNKGMPIREFDYVAVYDDVLRLLTLQIRIKLEPRFIKYTCEPNTYYALCRINPYYKVNGQQPFKSDDSSKPFKAASPNYRYNLNCTITGASNSDHSWEAHMAASADGGRIYLFTGKNNQIHDANPKSSNYSDKNAYYEALEKDNVYIYINGTIPLTQAGINSIKVGNIITKLPTKTDASKE